MIEQLIPVLESMVSNHAALLEISKEKTEIIKNGDIQGLDKILIKEEALANRIGQLETKRLNLVMSLLNCPQEEATFSALITVSPEAYKEKLEAIQLELMNLVFDLKYQNDLNQSLLKQSLEWVHLNMSLLQPQVKSVTYSKRRTNMAETPPSFSGTTSSSFDFRA